MSYSLSSFAALFREVRETAVETNQELRECPDGRLLVAVSARKMNVDLCWKTALSIRSARLAKHNNTTVVEFPFIIPSITALQIMLSST
jgi:hypothetical protein